MSKIRASEVWKELKPFALRDLGASEKSGSDPDAYAILLYRATRKTLSRYSVTPTGLLSAMRASVSGDVVLVPAATIALHEGGTDEIFPSLASNTKALDLGAGNTGNDPPTDWNTVGYDDSAWDSAVAITEPTVKVGSADALWLGDPLAGNRRKAFRHHFVVSAFFSSAQLVWDADDWTNGIYVNGTLVDQWHNAISGDDHPPRSVDVSSLITSGNNVIAIDNYDDWSGGAGVSWELTISDSDIIVPAGVELVGLTKNSVLSGGILNYGKITNITVTGAITGTGEYFYYNTDGLLVTNKQIKSTVATGTAPLVVDSETLVTNLNADMTDGQHIPKLTYDATVAPGVGDDSADGYSVGSVWIDVTNDKAYVCLDATVGAAVWQEIGGGGVSDAADVTYTPTTLTDWDADTDPGNVDGALDQLAERVADNELLIPSSPTGMIFSQVVDVEVVNTLTETTLFGAGRGSRTIPANTLDVGTTIRITLAGHLSDTGAPTLTIDVDLGGTQIASTGSQALNTSVTGVDWHLTFLITCRSTGVTGKVVGSGLFQHDNDGQFGMVNSAEVSVDTTSDLAVNVTAQWGTADMANTMTSQTATIELMKADNLEVASPSDLTATEV
jgi:hypothetical protein